MAARADVVAAGLVVLGALLPWNTDLGLFVSGSGAGPRTALVATTLVALVALLRRRATASTPDGPARRGRVAAMLPLGLLAAVTAVGAVIQNLGDDGGAPWMVGVGPGALLAVAGVVLALSPPLVGARDGGRRRAVCRWVMVALVAAAVVATVLAVYRRTRFVDESVDGAAAGGVVIAAAVLYAFVPLVPLAVVVGWVRSRRQSSAHALVAVASATVVALAAVAVLPVGREVDAFHGVAAASAVAGVGFEFTLLCLVAGAAWATTAVATTRAPGAAAADMLRAAARAVLVLVVAWCAGSALLRMVDMALSSVLALPESPYTSAVSMAFDVLTGVLAVWALLNERDAVPGVPVIVGYGVLAGLAVSRVAVGIVIVPRSAPLDPADIGEVWGNTIVHQITGTFDVILGVLAAAMLVAALRRRRGSRVAPPTGAVRIARSSTVAASR